MSQYSELLKDPRWQKKRLEILERDNWTCQWCEAKSKTIVVHHKRYISGLLPWDYPDGLLITLCEECHQIESETRPLAENKLLLALRDRFTYLDLIFLADSIPNIPKDCRVSTTTLVICDLLDKPDNLRNAIQEYDKKYVA